MWATIRILKLFIRSLSRIATALEGIHTLYKLDLASRGIVPQDYTILDPVEISYGDAPVED